MAAFDPHPRTAEGRPERRDEGFALIGLVVAIFIILLLLSVAAPTVARSLKRDRELEAARRADAYTRAIRKYYLKNGNHYPGSLDQLEKTNNIRFLRQRYSDPFTGKPDWRLIKVGENKTTVKGLFGQPLGGLPAAGLGGGFSPGGNPTSSFGTPSAGSGASPNVGTPAAGSTPGQPNVSGDSGTSATPSAPGGFTGQSGSAFSGTGAPFMGVGLPVAGSAIIVVNEQTTYPEWEFLYDPRIEQLRAKVNLFGGGMSSSGATGLGSGSGLNPGSSGSTPLGTPPQTPNNGPAQTPTVSQ